MNINKLLSVTEVLGSDYNTDDLHISTIQYIIVQCIGMLFMILATVLWICSPILSMILLIGITIVYCVVLSVNDHNDVSMLLTIPLSIFIGVCIILMIK